MCLRVGMCVCVSLRMCSCVGVAVVGFVYNVVAYLLLSCLYLSALPYLALSLPIALFLTAASLANAVFCVTFFNVVCAFLVSGQLPCCVVSGYRKVRREGGRVRGLITILIYHKTPSGSQSGKRGREREKVRKWKKENNCE